MDTLGSQFLTLHVTGGKPRRLATDVPGAQLVVGDVVDLRLITANPDDMKIVVHGTKRSPDGRHVFAHRYGW